VHHANFRSFARYLFILLINTAAVFVVFNLLVWGWYTIFDNFFEPFSNRVEKYYHINIDKYYPDLTKNEINKLLIESYQPFQHEPFVEFRERARSGIYVNVDENGFRRSTAQSRWPPNPHDPVIFVFGGSTTFGYGVRDEDTVVSAISNAIRKDTRYSRAQIYNFGRGFYWSTQENILFTTVLLSAVKPSMAIFIDGLNEFYYSRQSPAFSDVMKSAFEREIEIDGATVAGPALSLWRDMVRLFSSLPMVRLAGDVNSRHLQFPRLLPNNPEGVRASIANYRMNKAMIEKLAELHSVEVLFVWQPISSFDYPPDLHKEFEARWGFGPHSQSFYGYQQMRQLNEFRQEKNFVWCASVHKNASAPLYVDLVHYNRQGAELLANCIVDAIRNQVK
jgi:hypothetical protein